MNMEPEMEYTLEFKKQGKGLKWRKIKHTQGKKSDDLICTDSQPELGYLRHKLYRWVIFSSSVQKLSNKNKVSSYLLTYFFFWKITKYFTIHFKN